MMIPIIQLIAFTIVMLMCVGFLHAAWMESRRQKKLANAGRPDRSYLNKRTADTPAGNELLSVARSYGRDRRYDHLTDAQLIRLAYWGESGDA